MPPPPPSPSNDNQTVTVRRARVGSIDIYEVKDNELDILEKGGPMETQFNFAVFLFSLAFSSTISLFTATFKSEIIQDIFGFVAVVGFLGSVYLFIQWYQDKKPIKSVIKDIRDRMPNDQPPTDDQSPVGQEDSQSADSHYEPAPPPS